MTVTGSATGGAYTQLSQAIESARRLSGKTVTLSLWASGSAALKLGVGFYQSFGTGGTGISGIVYSSSQQVTTSTTFTRYSLTFVLPSTAGKTFGTNGDDLTQLILTFSDPAFVGAQTGSVSIWGVQLEVGSTATPLEKIDPQQDLAKCQRFYFTETKSKPAATPLRR